MIDLLLAGGDMLAAQLNVAMMNKTPQKWSWVPAYMMDNELVMGCKRYLCRKRCKKVSHKVCHLAIAAVERRSTFCNPYAWHLIFLYFTSTTLHLWNGSVGIVSVYVPSRSDVAQVLPEDFESNLDVLGWMSSPEHGHQLRGNSMKPGSAGRVS